MNTTAIPEDFLPVTAQECRAPLADSYRAVAIVGGKSYYRYRLDFTDLQNAFRIARCCESNHAVLVSVYDDQGNIMHPALIPEPVS